MKRQGNLSDQEFMERQARIKTEEANDGEIMNGSPKNEKNSIPRIPIYNFTKDNSNDGEILAGSGATEVQNCKRRVKRDLLTNGQHNNENDVNASNIAAKQQFHKNGKLLKSLPCRYTFQ